MWLSGRNLHRLLRRNKTIWPRRGWP